MKNYFKKIDFSKYSSLHIGPISEVLVINEIGDYSDYEILGRANNVLISQNHPKFAILGEKFDYIEQKDGFLRVGCATKSGKLLSYAKRENIANMEFLGKLPGTLGGLVKMNAGLKQWEIFNYIHSIKTNKGYIKKKSIEYSYRSTNIDTIVYEVVFKIEHGYSQQNSLMFKKMRDNQPQMPSAGSCFANPKDDFAGRLIQAVGLKGYKKGGMGFSNEHANFLVNYGGGTYQEAIYMINLAQEKIKQEFNIDIQKEIIVY
ncbi:MAG: UDP-N-acetylmuramate dehydrogenase [Campylobacterota bacterium]